MANDEKIKETFEVSVDKDSKIISIIFLKGFEIEDSIRRSELVREAVFEILDKSPNVQYKAFINLIDLKGKGGGDLACPESKEIYRQIVQDKRLGQVAILLSNPVLEILGGLVAKSANAGEKVKFFSNKEQALNWLGV